MKQSAFFLFFPLARILQSLRKQKPKCRQSRSGFSWKKKMTFLLNMANWKILEKNEEQVVAAACRAEGLAERQTASPHLGAVGRTVKRFLHRFSPWTRGSNWASVPQEAQDSWLTYGKDLGTREKPRNQMWGEIMWPTAGIHELHIKEGLIARNVNCPFPKKDKLIAGGLKWLPKESRLLLKLNAYVCFYKG